MIIVRNMKSTLRNTFINRKRNEKRRSIINSRKNISHLKDKTLSLKVNDDTIFPAILFR
jgi:hypothetical protein